MFFLRIMSIFDKNPKKSGPADDFSGYFSCRKHRCETCKSGQAHRPGNATEEASTGLPPPEYPHLHHSEHIRIV